MTPPGVSIWHFIWWLSEESGVGLGRFAPFVFGRMIGRKGERKMDECEITQIREQNGWWIFQFGNGSDFHEKITAIKEDFEYGTERRYDRPGGAAQEAPMYLVITDKTGESRQIQNGRNR